MGRKPTATPAEVGTYAAAMITQQELADLLGLAPSTVSEMLQKPAYRAAWDNARSNTRFQLRKRQIEDALGGDRTMQIWCGKQYLDQRDSPRELDIKTDVQVTYIAKWGGGAAALPEGSETELIEGQVEEET